MFSWMKFPPDLSLRVCVVVVVVPCGFMNGVVIMLTSNFVPASFYQSFFDP